MNIQTDALRRYLADLPVTAKWLMPDALPTALQGEWRRWLAQAQREEEGALLRYWASRAQYR